MIVSNRYFYFGKIPSENIEETPAGWEPGWYYRVVIHTMCEEISIESNVGMSVPIQFDSMFELSQVLNKVSHELVSSLLGAPNPNV